MIRVRIQNLNEKRVNGVQRNGSALRHGRGWIYVRPNAERYDRIAHAEWGFFMGRSWLFAADVRLGSHDGPEIGVHLALAGCFLFAYVGAPRWVFRMLRPMVGRRVGLNWYKGALKIETFTRAFDDWRRNDPWWKHGITINPTEILLGRRKGKRAQVGQTLDVLIPMAEGPYPATAKLEEWNYRRPRWPWWPCTIAGRSWAVEIPGGIPSPGKGENSWDCGDDGTFGISGIDVERVEQAIGYVVASVLRDRIRYGGKKYLTTPWKKAMAEK